MNLLITNAARNSRRRCRRDSLVAIASKGTEKRDAKGLRRLLVCGIAIAAFLCVVGLAGQTGMGVLEVALAIVAAMTLIYATATVVAVCLVEIIRDLL